MRVRIPLTLLCSLTLGLLVAAEGPPEDAPHWDPVLGTLRGTGLPPRLACYALPSDTGYYNGYYVGGGCPTCRGRPRGPLEGTWGWDYMGRLFPHNVCLQWWPGRRRQGGTGAYRIDGPHLLHLATHPHKEECEP